ncbi:MAG: MerR family transcriptional regulator [Polyangiaceae bacterium]|nr:MerR family transcriptional regulator [Polyangiaceae bacterium]
MAEYKLVDLAEAVGMTPRGVRYYLKRGILPAVEFRGGSTRYGDEHLARLRAIVRLRTEERLRLTAIKARLAKLSPSEIAALAAGTEGGAAGAAVSPPPRAASSPAPVAGGEVWERIALLPGLELHVRRDAAPVVRRFAAEVRSQCAAVSTEQP